MPDVDRLFEELFGFPGTKKPEEGEETPAPLGATVPAAPPRKAKVMPEDDLRKAVMAVREALENATGRRKQVDHWRSVAATALGLKRLVTSKWEAIIAKGEEMQQFRLDKESLSYPILALVEREPDHDLEDEGTEETEEGLFPRSMDIKPPPPPAPMPENWNPPEAMDCGHFNWWLRKNEDGTTHCEACKKNYIPLWDRLRGQFVRPLPPGIRRTEEKVRMGGFPGYCCDDAGFYIGGDINDCRRAHPGPDGPRCAYHKANPKG